MNMIMQFNFHRRALYADIVNWTRGAIYNTGRMMMMMNIMQRMTAVIKIMKIMV